MFLLFFLSINEQVINSLRPVGKFSPACYPPGVTNNPKVDLHSALRIFKMTAIIGTFYGNIKKAHEFPPIKGQTYMYRRPFLFLEFLIYFPARQAP